MLVLTDHFTRYTLAFVVQDTTAATTARYLWKHFFSVFGAPAALLSDRGGQFESKVIAELCDLLGIKKIRTTAYSPQCNGAVERRHQTITAMIGKLGEQKKAEWPEHLPELVHAYNCTRSGISGYSPYYLMFGRRPRLPVDLYFPTVQTLKEIRTIDTYAAGLRVTLRAAFVAAREASMAEAQRQKRHYDRSANAVDLEEGDEVLIKRPRRGHQKIVDRWGEGVYRVSRRAHPSLQVYYLYDIGARVEIPDPIN